MKNKNYVENSLTQIFEDNWDKVFIFDSINNRNITYGNFFKKSLYLKEELEKKGLKKGDFLCLIVDNSVELATIYFASLFLGIIAIPIDPYKGKNEINEILEQFNNKKIICDQKSSDNFPLSISLKELDGDKNELNKDSLKILKEINFATTFLITFTSGTSGKQKGVMHSFNNLFKSAMVFRKKFNFGNQNIFLHNLPMTYMAGILNLLILPLISESQIVISERSMISNISKFWDVVTKFYVNTFWLIPTILELLIKLDRGVNGIEYTKNNKITICVGTSPLNISTKENFEKKYHVKVFESYGLSETLFVSTNFSENDKGSSVGKLLEDVELKFFDEEIGVKVPWMFLGYYNMDEKTYFKDSFYLTGDLGKMSESFLLIVGRKKDIIIKGGVNISPRKIEEILNNTNVFSEVSVLGFPSKIFGEKIVCFGVLNRDMGKIEEKSLNKEIVERLGANYSIDEFVYVKKIPKNLNGKIDKLKIQQIFGQKINDS